MVESFQSILLQQAAAHPTMQPQDTIKLCYQATFGAEHLLCRESDARQYFLSEYSEVPASDEPLHERISDSYVRMNLSAWKAHRLPAEWLFRLFYATASNPTPQEEPEFSVLLDTVDALASAGSLPFSASDWNRARVAYENSGGGAVHHSPLYRTREHPAYRLVHVRYLGLLPLLEALARLPQTDEVQVIAIDGRAASGKTTLAETLAAILDGQVIHMDDFFLPKELRTPHRLSLPGGNIHSERFAAEVLPNLRKTEPFSYRCYDCKKAAYGEARVIRSAPYRVVEGSYSFLPSLGAYMDFRIFCDVSKELQLARIEKRNGHELAGQFAAVWIPMEETYFSAFPIQAKADMVCTFSDGYTIWRGDNSI